MVKYEKNGNGKVITDVLLAAHFLQKNISLTANVSSKNLHKQDGFEIALPETISSHIYNKNTDINRCQIFKVSANSLQFNLTLFPFLNLPVLNYSLNAFLRNYVSSYDNFIRYNTK